jgi:hypothetical protein
MDPIDVLERPRNALRRRTGLRPLVLVLCGLAACGGRVPETIDREVFIDTYVDLRTAALDTDSTKVSETERTDILARHGVTEDDLVTFADVHATELEFMRDVWNDVELRMDRTGGGG